MEQQSIRKTYKYKLKPTPEQERVLDRTLMLCRHVYNAAVGERREAWRMRGVSVTYYQQKAELPGIKEAMPEYAEVNAPGLAGCGAAGRPRLPGVLPPSCAKGRHRAIRAFTDATATTASPIRRWASMAARGWTTASWSSPRSGVSPCAGRRPLEGTPKTVTISREADGWYVCFSCADVPVQPLPATGQETGIDLGIEAFATLSDGTRIFHPGWYRKAERALKTAQRRVTRAQEGQQPPAQGGHAAGQGASDGAAPATGLSPQDGARTRARPTTRSITRTCSPPTW